MDSTTLSRTLANAPASLKQISQRNWYQIVAPTGVKAYIAQPGKRGESGKVQLSGFGYRGLPAGLELPAAAVKAITDNGAVSLEVSLEAAPRGWLDRLLAALPGIAPEADPRATARKGRRVGAVAPDLADLVMRARMENEAAASSHASPDASDDASSDDPIGDVPVLEDMTDEELEEATAPPA